MSTIEELLDTLTDAAAPGNLEYGGERLRVWLEEAEHAPDPAVTHRVPGGLYYYDVSLDPGEIRLLDPPESFLDVELVGPDAPPHPTGLMAAKEWVPYEGPRGGSGWENTISGAVSYGEEPPEPERVNPDDITEDDLGDIGIQTTQAWRETTPGELDEGWEVGFQSDNGREFRGTVTGVTDDAVTVETRALGEMEVPVEDGEPATDLFRQKPIFVGSGPAGADTPWLPRDEPPNKTQLAAEAARSAAATEGYGNTESMESFAALASARGASDEDIRSAVDFASHLRPTTTDDELEEAVQSGLEMAETEDPDEIEQLHYDRAATGDPPDNDSVSEKAEGGGWVPYEGPRGGEGWKNADSGEVIYDDEAAGSVIGVDDLPDRVWDYGSIDETSEGDVVKFLDADMNDDFGVVESVDGMDIVVLDPDGNRHAISDFDLQARLDLERADAANEGRMTDDAVRGALDGKELSGMTDAVPDLLREGANPDAVADAIIEMTGDWTDDIMDASASMLLEDVKGSSGDVSYNLMSGQSTGTHEHQTALRGEEYHRNVKHNLSGWVGPMFDEKAAPLWQHMADKTGNTNIPESSPTEGNNRMVYTSDIEPKEGSVDDLEAGDEVWFHDAMEGETEAVIRAKDDDIIHISVRGAGLLDEPVDQSERENMEALHEATTEALREEFGDTMTVFRGYSGAGNNPSNADSTNVSTKMREAKEAGETVSMEHRPGESWTTDPQYAASYAPESDDGVVVANEVPVERVAASAHTTPLSASETETIIMHDEVEEYDPDDVIPAQSDEFENELFRRAVRAAAGVVENE